MTIKLEHFLLYELTDSLHSYRGAARRAPADAAAVVRGGCAYGASPVLGVDQGWSVASAASGGA